MGPFSFFGDVFVVRPAACAPWSSPRSIASASPPFSFGLSRPAGVRASGYRASQRLACFLPSRPAAPCTPLTCMLLACAFLTCAPRNVLRASALHKSRVLFARFHPKRAAEQRAFWDESPRYAKLHSESGEKARNARFLDKRNGMKPRVAGFLDKLPDGPELRRAIAARFLPRVLIGCRALLSALRIPLVRLEAQSAAKAKILFLPCQGSEARQKVCSILLFVAKATDKAYASLILVSIG